jgi:hypothetical protein
VSTVRHGTANAYRNHKCRCPHCVQAHNTECETMRLRRFALTATAGGIAPIPVHNAATYTNWGCRCDTCRAAERARGATRRAETATQS